ncbi:hypothetical protein NQ318_010640 [Aromia moschata]|uniref:Uncharacterized protein n=1 Tax=Aromia moschata TaxID=1265417 RepID=A0AAV8XKP5_9CUCU|nr:hypothetical protein NQ318_010640 [Aromia moschata]
MRKNAHIKCKLFKSYLKMIQIDGCSLQGLFMLALAYSGCNSSAAIVFLTLAVASNGAVSTGPLASMVDISPNYASSPRVILRSYGNEANFELSVSLRVWFRYVDDIFAFLMYKLSKKDIQMEF